MIIKNENKKKDKLSELLKLLKEKKIITEADESNIKKNG
jgi:hypothetical protein